MERKEREGKEDRKAQEDSWQRRFVSGGCARLCTQLNLLVSVGCALHSAEEVL